MEQSEEIKFVFISHKNDVQPDAGICQRLYDYLSSQGICCWMDRMDMRSGSWQAQIIKNIQKASAFILIESENSLLSEQVHIEIARLAEFNADREVRCPLIPLALDNSWNNIGRMLESVSEAFQNRLRTTIHVMGMGSLQKVILDKFETEEKAFEELKNYLPREITHLKNNPADFQLSVDGKTLKNYVGHDSFVEIPSYICEISDGAFKNNRELISVIIPDSVEKIGKKAFFGCSNLSQVDGMGGVKEIHTSAFDYTKFMAEDGKNFVVNGVLFGKKAGDGEKLPAVAVIAQNAFRGCKAEKLEFEEGLEIVGEGAFAESYLLQSIIFPSSLKKIGNKAFLDCNKLQEVVFKGAILENAHEIFKTAKLTEEE